MPAKTDLMVFWVLHEKRPVAMCERIPLLHTEKNLGQMGLPSLPSSSFWRYCELDLGSLLINPLSNSTVPSSTAQTVCGSAFSESKQWDLSAVWHFMMSVTGDAADVQLAFTGYLGAKTATEIVRLRTNIQYFQLTNTVSPSAVWVMFVYNGCFCWFFLPVYTNTMPHNSLFWHIAQHSSTPEEDLPLISQ